MSKPKPIKDRRKGRGISLHPSLWKRVIAIAGQHSTVSNIVQRALLAWLEKK